jgi:hypothetical protein
VPPSPLYRDPQFVSEVRRLGAAAAGDSSGSDSDSMPRCRWVARRRRRVGSGQLRSGQVRLLLLVESLLRYITRPKSGTMRVTRHWQLPRATSEVSTGLNLATLE